VIDSADYFTSLTHTLLTFETDGAGEPVVLYQGQSAPMPGDEYRDQGIVFTPAVEWVNDAGDTFDDAQAIGGSPEIGIPLGDSDDFFASFTTPTLSFGCWVINIHSFAVPVFTAYDAGGRVIEQVTFEGNLVDGSIWGAEYGFMGIASPIPIARVRIQKQAAMFDDFRFTRFPDTAIARGLLLH